MAAVKQKDSSIIHLDDELYYAKLMKIKEAKKRCICINQTNTDALRDALDRELFFWEGVESGVIDLKIK